MYVSYTAGAKSPMLGKLKRDLGRNLSTITSVLVPRAIQGFSFKGWLALLSRESD